MKINVNFEINTKLKMLTTIKTKASLDSHCVLKFRNTKRNTEKDFESKSFSLSLFIFIIIISELGTNECLIVWMS